MRLSTLLLAVVAIKTVSVAHAQAVPFDGHDATVSKSHPITFGWLQRNDQQRASGRMWLFSPEWR
jgi:hypothetical protein